MTKFIPSPNVPISQAAFPPALVWSVAETWPGRTHSLKYITEQQFTGEKSRYEMAFYVFHDSFIKGQVGERTTKKEMH